MLFFCPIHNCIRMDVWIATGSAIRDVLAVWKFVLWTVFWCARRTVRMNSNKWCIRTEKKRRKKWRTQWSSHWVATINHISCQDTRSHIISHFWFMYCAFRGCSCFGERIGAVTMSHFHMSLAAQGNSFIFEFCSFWLRVPVIRYCLQGGVIIVCDTQRLD